MRRVARRLDGDAGEVAGPEQILERADQQPAKSQ